MPKDKQRVIFNLKSISDPNEVDKYSYIFLQSISCVFLFASLAGALVAVAEMASVMVGDTSGPYAGDNFEFAIVAMRVSVFCFIFGIISSATVYLEDFVALYTGKPSIATTKLEKLPKRAPRDKVWSYILIGALCGFMIILLLIEQFVPFNQWIKMTIALAAGILLIASTRPVYSLYVRIRSKRITTEDKADNNTPE